MASCLYILCADKVDDNDDSAILPDQVDELTTLQDVKVEFSSTTDKIKQVCIATYCAINIRMYKLIIIYIYI